MTTAVAEGALLWEPSEQLKANSRMAEYMRWLSTFPRDAREIGGRGAMHIAAHHGVDAVARQYWEVLRSVA